MNANKRFGYKGHRVQDDVKENEKYHELRHSKTAISVKSNIEKKITSPKISRLQKIRVCREEKQIKKKVEIVKNKIPVKKISYLNRRPLATQNSNPIKDVKSTVKVTQAPAVIKKAPHSVFIKKPVKDNIQNNVKGVVKKIQTSQPKPVKADASWSPNFAADISLIEPVAGDVSFAPHDFTFCSIENVDQFDFIPIGEKSSFSGKIPKRSTPLRKKPTEISKENVNISKPKPVLPLSKPVYKSVKPKLEVMKLKAPLSKGPVIGYQNKKTIQQNNGSKNVKVKLESNKIPQLQKSKTKTLTNNPKLTEKKELSQITPPVSKIPSINNTSKNSVKHHSWSKVSNIKKSENKCQENSESVKISRSVEELQITKNESCSVKSVDKIEKTPVRKNLDRNLLKPCLQKQYRLDKECTILTKSNSKNNKLKKTDARIKSGMRQRIFSKSYSDVSLIENEEFPSASFNLDELDNSSYISCASFCSAMNKTPLTRRRDSVEMISSKFKKLNIKSETQSIKSSLSSSYLSVFDKTSGEETTQWHTVFDTLYTEETPQVKDVFTFSGIKNSNKIPFIITPAKITSKSHLNIINSEENNEVNVIDDSQTKDIIIFDDMASLIKTSPCITVPAKASNELYENVEEDISIEVNIMDESEADEVFTFRDIKSPNKIPFNIMTSAKVTSESYSKIINSEDNNELNVIDETQAKDLINFNDILSPINISSHLISAKVTGKLYANTTKENFIMDKKQADDPFTFDDVKSPIEIPCIVMTPAETISEFYSNTINLEENTEVTNEIQAKDLINFNDLMNSIEILPHEITSAKTMNKLNTETENIKESIIIEIDTMDKIQAKDALTFSDIRNPIKISSNTLVEVTSELPSSLITSKENIEVNVIDETQAKDLINGISSISISPAKTTSELHTRDNISIGVNVMDETQAKNVLNVDNSTGGLSNKMSSNATDEVDIVENSQVKDIFNNNLTGSFSTEVPCNITPVTSELDLNTSENKCTEVDTSKETLERDVSIVNINSIEVLSNTTPVKTPSELETNAEESTEVGIAKTAQTRDTFIFNSNSTEVSPSKAIIPVKAISELNTSATSGRSENSKGNISNKSPDNLLDMSMTTVSTDEPTHTNDIENGSVMMTDHETCDIKEESFIRDISLLGTPRIPEHRTGPLPSDLIAFSPKFRF